MGLVIALITVSIVALGLLYALVVLALARHHEITEVQDKLLFFTEAVLNKNMSIDFRDFAIAQSMGKSPVVATEEPVRTFGNMPT